MRTVDIQRTDLRVSCICLGTADMGASIRRAVAFRMLDEYVAQGGNFIDTAKVYSDWIPGTSSTSEKLIGEWLRKGKLRGKVMVATKGAHPHLRSMHRPRLSPQEILSDIHASLAHLGVEQIDLYYLHRDDPNRPVEEIIDTLAGAQRAGKLRAFACSNWRVERLRAANEYAARQGLPGFSASQVMWSLAEVNPASIDDPTIVVMDGAMQTHHRQTGLAAIPFSSQANGFFSKLAEKAPPRMNASLQRMYGSPENLRRLERARQVAAECGFTISQVVLGYLLSQPFPTIPIIGPRTPDQLADSLRAAGVQLSPVQLRYLECGENPPPAGDNFPQAEGQETAANA